MRFAKTLRIITTILLSLAAAMTLLGGIGTSCVAFAAENFGPAMAPLIPVKPIFQVLVAVSLLVAAIITLAPHINWVLGLMMAAANVTGGVTGARMALSRGNGFIRKVLLVVVAALVVRLSYDLVMQLR